MKTKAMMMKTMIAGEKMMVDRRYILDCARVCVCVCVCVCVKLYDLFCELIIYYERCMIISNFVPRAFSRF
jgi:hypothetical protein